MTQEEIKKAWLNHRERQEAEWKAEQDNAYAVGCITIGYALLLFGLVELLFKTSQ